MLSLLYTHQAEFRSILLDRLSVRFGQVIRRGKVYIGAKGESQKARKAVFIYNIFIVGKQDGPSLRILQPQNQKYFHDFQ